MDEVFLYRVTGGAQRRVEALVHKKKRYLTYKRTHPPRTVP